MYYYATSMIDKVMNLHYQMLESLTLYNEIKGYDGVDDVVIIGMGGSGIVGDFVKGIVGDSTRVRVVKSSNPPRMSSSTLAIGVTYSGNTRETLIAMHKAASYNAKTVLVTSKKDLYLNNDHNLKDTQYITINGNGYSRASLGYMLAPVLLVLEKSNIVSNIRKDIKEAVDILCNIARDRSKIEHLKYQMMDKMLVVYAEEFTQVAALRWKQMMNENAKLHCYYDTFPELLHNEIETWYGNTDNYTLVLLRDEMYEKSKEYGYNLYDLINTTKELLRSKGVNVVELFSIGDSALTRLLSLSYLGDILSVHLAYASNIDPTKIPNIDYVKSMSNAMQGVRYE